MISENKIKHSLAVARKCAQLAHDQGMNENAQNACFVMGLLHDIGYEINPTNTHPKTSYYMLCHMEMYKYEVFEAIRDHGTKYKNLTEFDKILNTADLMIGYDGTELTPENRIQQIAEYHGEDSTHIEHAKAMFHALFDAPKTN